MLSLLCVALLSGSEPPDSLAVGSKWVYELSENSEDATEKHSRVSRLQFTVLPSNGELRVDELRQVKGELDVRETYSMGAWGLRDARRDAPLDPWGFRLRRSIQLVFPLSERQPYEVDKFQSVGAKSIPAASWELTMGPLKRNLSPYDYSVKFQEAKGKDCIEGQGKLQIWPSTRFPVSSFMHLTYAGGTTNLSLKLIEPKPPFRIGG